MAEISWNQLQCTKKVIKIDSGEGIGYVNVFHSSQKAGRLEGRSSVNLFELNSALAQKCVFAILLVSRKLNW